MEGSMSYHTNLDPQVWTKVQDAFAAALGLEEDEQGPRPMGEDEEGEAAIERYSDEDAPPTEEKPTANESQRPGQISEGFLKWLMISKATDLVLESMNEADADVVDKVMKDESYGLAFTEKQLKFMVLMSSIFHEPLSM